MGTGMKSLKWEGTGTKNLFPHTSTMVQLMPLPLTVSCSSKIQIGLPFWYRLTQVVPEKGPLNECVFFSYVILDNVNPCLIRQCKCTSV